MKKLITTTIILLLVMQVFGQEMHRVKGLVTLKVNGAPQAGVNIHFKGSSTGAVSDINGKYSFLVPNKKGVLIFSYIGLKTLAVKISGDTVINVAMENDVVELSEVVVTKQRNGAKMMASPIQAEAYDMSDIELDFEPFNTEEYATIRENKFISPLDHALSTFSIDVDNASYANVRRFLDYGQKPPIDAVRIEEMINYFEYDYEHTDKEHPFSIDTELSYAPWNKENVLLKIGLQAKEIAEEDLPESNLVFLIDVSGSMNSANKLPLLKESFKLLVEKLKAEDHVSIVVYAGAAGVVLEPTSGENKDKIIASLDMLEAGGSTAGGQGIKLAYEMAKRHFKPESNNRIILATDGDFNIGASSNAEMERLIEKKREEGVYLTVLGYGMGNYKDSKMEILADKGNGNYAYIDNLKEAQKVLVNQMAGTLFTIAKDVKLQLEFNPQHVKAYRLIGYENRKLNKEDFNDDKKDAGEMGAGHTVTALYEIIPVNSETEFNSQVDELKYQNEQQKVSRKSNEMLTVKMRYKKPGSDSSIKFEKVVLNKISENASDNFKWAASVAAFGMMLRESEFIKGFNYNELLELAKAARGADPEGYRIEFIKMVESSHLIAKR